MTSLGDKITKHRERLGLSIQDLAVNAGLYNADLLAIETGAYGAVAAPRLATLAALARALGISPLLLAAAAFDDLETVE
jgi:transcriptional regulator with XRE-family HTH domain